MSDLCCPHSWGLTWDVSCLSVTMTLTCPDTLHQDTPQPRWDVWGTRYLYTYYIVSQHHLAKTTNITMWSPLSHQVNVHLFSFHNLAPWNIKSDPLFNSPYFHPFISVGSTFCSYLWPLIIINSLVVCCEILLIWPFLINCFILQMFQT